MSLKNWHQEWGFGANFTPSTAVNQLEMWAEDTFDPETIDRELGWAAGIGMTLMRVYLHDLAYEVDKDGFLKRLEQYLDIAERRGIRTLPVFFDDCWNPEFAAGKQPAPVPCVHNSGWVQSPGNRVASSREYGRLEKYVKAVLKHFSGDERILGWDLYNEPGGGGTCNQEDSYCLLEAVFDWAQEVRPTQPVTAGVWAWTEDLWKLIELSLERSEIVTFHCYEPPKVLNERISVMRLLAGGRPLLCTEYMARTRGSTFAECLPLLKQRGIPAINWGLVAGKTNTIYPYGWDESKGKPEKWFHDVFQPDGSLLYPEEGEIFKGLK